MQFITATGYDVAAIMRAAHASAKRMRAGGAWDGRSYAEAFSFYLAQRWYDAQHEHRARLCTGATVTVAKAFDNGGSPLWRM